MSPLLKSTLWWIAAIVLTLVAARYQKMTGPTYPVNGTRTINGKEIKYSLIRTANNDKDAMISIEIPDKTITGVIEFRRYKSYDTLTRASMLRDGDQLYFMMPKQPAAGKMEYTIILSNGTENLKLSAKDDKPVVMRFKGPVPFSILIPHVILMFLGLLFSTRTAIEALIKGSRTYKYAIWTLIFLIPGGLILGPIVQKYAFGAYWTGWPFGHDLTDNKTLVMVVVWIIAAFKLRNDPGNKIWPVVAALVVMIVYLIPHSVLGSEIDHTRQNPS
jgi:hypothetical protein